jgi:crotonobetainyl-CoA:carnitine CoA-transferase CaiB-like acyl-CoA transferase/citrate lyase beta subunit
MLAKARSFDVDMVVVDLEDGVAVNEKNDRTRAAAAAALTGAAWRARAVGVRVNELGSEWGQRDIEALVEAAGHQLAVIALPKVESAAEVQAADRLISRLEAALDLPQGAIGIDVLIETARGLVEVERIAAAASRLRALVFGPGDYAASIGATGSFIGANANAEEDPLLFARQRVVAAARAFGLQPIDGPYADFRDNDGLSLSAQRARQLGFAGKWVIHPAQIEICEEAFTPDENEVANAQALLAAYADAGAVGVDGVMIDAAAARAAKMTLTRSAAGRHAGALLEGIRILAFEQFGAGPWATLQLADLGADVIKVEDPAVDGDLGRYVPPFAEGASSLYFESFNRNKRSLSLDLRTARGRKMLHDLIPAVDVVFSNLRGDQPTRLGLRYSDLSHLNPRLVCVSLSGFGMSGPRSGEGAYDATIQALAGWMSVTGGPSEPPTRAGLSLVDFCGGYVSALAILAGVIAARRDGRGRDADLSLFETALALLSYMGTWSASRDWAPQRLPDSAHQTVVPFQMFTARDGFLVVACPKDSLWRRLCTALDLPDLATDRRFATIADRAANGAELTPLLAARFAERELAEWMNALRAVGVPCAAVNTIAEALADRQVTARDGIACYQHPLLGEVRTPATPLRFADITPPLRRAPFLGEHTSQLLTELCGYSKELVQEFADAGAREGEGA